MELVIISSPLNRLIWRISGETWPDIRSSGVLLFISKKNSGQLIACIKFQLILDPLVCLLRAISSYLLWPYFLTLPISVSLSLPPQNFPHHLPLSYHQLHLHPNFWNSSASSISTVVIIILSSHFLFSLQTHPIHFIFFLKKNYAMIR